MKRALFLSAAALLGLVWAGCTPDELSDGKDGKLTTITLSLADDAESADATTRVYHGYDYDEHYSHFLVVLWAEGDQIAIYDSADDTDPDVFTLASGAGSRTGTFTGRLTKTGTACTVVYPYIEGKKIGEISETKLFGGQNGTMDASPQYDWLMGSYNAETNTVSSFEHQVAYMHIINYDWWWENAGDYNCISVRGPWGDLMYYVDIVGPIDSAVVIAVPAVTVPENSDLYFTFYEHGLATVYSRKVPGGNIGGKIIKMFIDQNDHNPKSIPATEVGSYPVSGIHFNREYVTIDGLNWATCNVGASLPWLPGEKFTFGSFGENNAYYAGTDDIQGRTDLLLNDGTTIGGDVAAYRWGHGWKMPKCNGTDEALDILGDPDNNLTNGQGSPVYVPMSGYASGTVESYVILPADPEGYWENDVWSSSPYEDNNAWLFHYVAYAHWDTEIRQGQRYEGHEVRPLLDLPE